jgi:RecB family endonuclease NucS
MSSFIKNIQNPSVTDAYSFIEKYHKSKADKTLLVVLGDCIVDYRGRARSFLDWGERIIMIKQDGTLLVHQPIMREPVNWQPSDSKTEFKVEGDQLVFRSRHTKPPEKMKIVFRNIKNITATSLKDKASLVIAGMEADVVNEIVNNPDIVEEGLRVSKREKHVKSGMIDLFCYDKNHIPVIIEVKRSLANISSVQQLRMYVNDIKKDTDDADVRGILCAPRIPDMVKHLLSDYGLEWKEVERQIIMPDDFQKTLKDYK